MSIILKYNFITFSSPTEIMEKISERLHDVNCNIRTVTEACLLCTESSSYFCCNLITYTVSDVSERFEANELKLP